MTDKHFPECSSGNLGHPVDVIPCPIAKLQMDTKILKTHFCRLICDLIVYFVYTSTISFALSVYCKTTSIAAIVWFRRCLQEEFKSGCPVKDMTMHVWTTTVIGVCTHCTVMLEEAYLVLKMLYSAETGCGVLFV
jgi:hypothetical protein